MSQSYNKLKINTLKKELEEENTRREQEIAVFLAKNPKTNYQIKSQNGKISQIKYIINNKPIYVTTDNVSSATSTRTNFLQPGGALGLNIEGVNMHVATWDGGPTLASHQEFMNDDIIPSSRINNPDLSASNDRSDHSTHVSGTIVAKGITPTAKGMAPKATLTSFDWDNDDVEALNQASTNGLLLSNHSYGVPVQTSSNLNYLMGSYNSEARIWDDVAYNAPYYLQVVSAGNDGETTYTGGLQNNYDKLVGNKNSKNNLVVGNAVNPLINSNGSGDLISISINTQSSQGPTDDGRIKPDICADGTSVYSPVSESNTAYDYYSGTSMSAPNVTGSLLLLQEYYNRLNGKFMKASTLKGLVCHTADDDNGFGPDPIYGWGLLNSKAAAETILADSNQTALILEGILNQGEDFTYNFSVSSAEPLVATLCWTDVPGTTTNQLNNPSPRLINNLDLRVTNGSETFYPWKLDVNNVSAFATKGDNNVDTVENILIETPSAGSYTITISHKGSITNGSQNYSLILTAGNITLNTNDFEFKNSFVTWPNPSDDILNYQYKSANNYKSVISLVDVNGRVLYNNAINPYGTTISGSINTSNLSSGIYILNIEQGNFKLHKKIIIK
ncbi:MAG: hypothetical protein B7Z06_07275 [Flavobacteriales bacterium 32-35-8]|nr:MAG: hypothetical protein B7Z06_07275 [Flavobacteriales bacterium 32-35-8]